MINENPPLPIDLYIDEIFEYLRKNEVFFYLYFLFFSRPIMCANQNICSYKKI